MSKPRYEYKPAEAAIIAKPNMDFGQLLAYMTQGAFSPDALARWQGEREASIAEKAASTSCPFDTFAAFAAAASADDVSLQLSGADKPVKGKIKEFSSGSFGFNFTGKATLKIGGKPVKFQVNSNIVAIGSKPGAADSEESKAA